ncbi:RloB family protein, partial [Herbaspirillum rubrisubalbicans]
SATLYFRVNVRVQVVHSGHTDPIGIIRFGLKNVAKYDRIFCVIDRDSHETFNEAIREAEGHKTLSVIASFPCFEFWYLLHHELSNRPYKSAGKKSSGDFLLEHLRSFKEMAAYDKGSNVDLFTLLLPLFPDARKNAERVLKNALEIDELNPSTQVHLLMDFFEELAKS